jgi:hypothetical protein
MFGEWTETDRLPHLIMKYQLCGKQKPRTTTQMTSRMFVGPEQVTTHKTLQAVKMMMMIMMMMMMMMFC